MQSGLWCFRYMHQSILMNVFIVLFEYYPRNISQSKKTTMILFKVGWFSSRRETGIIGWAWSMQKLRWFGQHHTSHHDFARMIQIAKMIKRHDVWGWEQSWSITWQDSGHYNCSSQRGLKNSLNLVVTGLFSHWCFCRVDDNMLSKF